MGLITDNISKDLMDQFNSDFLEGQQKYNCSSNIVVRWNHKLRTTAGNCKRLNREAFEIQLNPRYLKEFGKDRVIGTFRHELAHVIAYECYNQKGHGKIFKSICKNLGGTMNESLGRNEYKDTATSHYIKPSYKYLYVCGCGQKFKRNRRFSSKMLYRKCVRCGEYVKDFKCYKL